LGFVGLGDPFLALLVFFCATDTLSAFTYNFCFYYVTTYICAFHGHILVLAQNSVAVTRMITIHTSHHNKVMHIVRGVALVYLKSPFIIVGRVWSFRQTLG
jgi:hypothetical protein